MTKRTWLILGATSLIAEEFAKLAARKGHNLILTGRNAELIELIAKDIKLRFAINCDFIQTDFSANINAIKDIFATNSHEIDLFIAYSSIISNAHLTDSAIKELIDTNIVSTIQLIQAYLAKPQIKHRVLFLSSVAGLRGRAKNSLYGASKKAVEVYIEGLAQAYRKAQFTIIRLGFIDTHQTYGERGIFYAASAKRAASASMRALKYKRFIIYYPFFWRFIMAIITRIPFVIYKRLKF